MTRDLRIPDARTLGLPHEHVFTRLGLSAGKGIGVFAIRDVPAGTDPFPGEASETTKVPITDVEAIPDLELRRFYFDFCPMVDGCFLAPISFNRLTVAWYLNHSDMPNIACHEAASFVTTGPILKGEELTVDYTTFSDHAERYVRMWRANAAAGPRADGQPKPSHPAQKEP